eukprot:7381779-Prymnesium_polylepis.2
MIAALAFAKHPLSHRSNTRLHPAAPATTSTETLVSSTRAPASGCQCRRPARPESERQRLPSRLGQGCASPQQTAALLKKQRVRTAKAARHCLPCRQLVLVRPRASWRNSRSHRSRSITPSSKGRGGVVQPAARAPKLSGRHDTCARLWNWRLRLAARAARKWDRLPRPRAECRRRCSAHQWRAAAERYIADVGRVGEHGVPRHPSPGHRWHRLCTAAAWPPGRNSETRARAPRLPVR